MVTLRPLDPAFPVRVEGRGTNFKNTIMDIIEERCKQSIKTLENIWKDIVESGLQNSKVCLDWLDKINEISVRN